MAFFINIISISMNNKRFIKNKRRQQIIIVGRKKINWNGQYECAEKRIVFLFCCGLFHNMCNVQFKCTSAGCLMFSVCSFHSYSFIHFCYYLLEFHLRIILYISISIWSPYSSSLLLISFLAEKETKIYTKYKNWNFTSVASSDSPAQHFSNSFLLFILFAFPKIIKKKKRNPEKISFLQLINRKNKCLNNERGKKGIPS